MDYHKLGLGPLASIVVGVEFSQWLQTATISCVYDPQGEHRAFSIIFSGCSQLTWELIEAEQPPADSAELLGIELGAAQHQHPALIGTDAFELAVRYNSYQIQTS
ncbi:MAG TPA: hypothetical protein VFS21_28550 [Roseiflexaceae bacterium]|nr:hypothetical protein [Roseiflexaceae bacterium]